MTKDYIKPASLMLARVFEDDMKAIFPNPIERKIKAPYVPELELRLLYDSSLMFIASPSLEGIAVWIHSDNWNKNTFWQLLTSGASVPAAKIGLKTFIKIRNSNTYVERKHRDLMTERHWYLSTLAVERNFQGKGFGSELLNGMLHRIDREGLPCYLETDGEKNIAIYQHFGFRTIDEFLVPGRGEKMVAMLRKPKRTSLE